MSPVRDAARRARSRRHGRGLRGKRATGLMRQTLMRLRLVADAHMSSAARGSWRLMLYGVLLLVAAAETEGGFWWQPATAHVAVGLGIWAMLVVLWPYLDSVVLWLIYAGRGWLPGPTEAPAGCVRQHS